MDAAPKLHLVDGSGYIFRAYYGIRPLSTRDGTPTNAVLGFARMLLKLLREERPEHLGIAFDTPEKNFRHAIYEPYKANREAPPEDLVPQFALIHELVEAMEIPLLMQPGFEADDVLATLAKRATARGLDVVLVTGDKDLMQLLDAKTSIFDPMRDRHFGVDGAMERFGVPPELVADVQALAGDSTDNIPGVPRVGLKTAAKLVSAHGDLDAVVAALKKQDKLSATERAILEHEAQARLSKRLTVLADDAPVELDLEALRYSLPRPERLAPFLRRIEATALLRELGMNDAPTNAATPGATAPAATADSDAATAAQATAGPPSEPVADPIDRSRYRTILSETELATLVNDIERAGSLSLDLETTAIDPTRADIVGFALAAPGIAPAYVPVAHHYLGVPKQLTREATLVHLRPIIERADFPKVGQNLKYDAIVLDRAGVRLRGIHDDAMLAAYVLDPARASYSLDTLAREVLGHETIHYEDVAGRGKDQRGFDAVDVETATRYAAEDADVALQLTARLRPKVAEAELLALYDELEVPLVPVLAAMEARGVRVDVGALGALGKELVSRLADVEARAHTLIGAPINLASPKQLAELFFDKLGYKPVKKTKTGYSTDQSVLEVLAKEHELPRVILEHRLLAKLRSTYVDALPKLVNPATGRVHTCYHQTGTATGRLSSTDPNLQNIPARTDDGRRIRAAFVAEPGWELVSADYSQIELRVMAHLSEDPHFIDAFVRGEDIHRRTAQEILTGGAEPDAEARRRAKAINFGILYGLSEFGLAKQLDIPRAEAQTYIATYFGRYPGIRHFLDRTIAEARERGFVTTLTGRRRFLPELRSKNGNVRQGAERIAMNTPIQGSAADLLKMAMLRVASAIERRGLRSRMLLQVHDELVLETPSTERDEVMELVREAMQEVMPLRVPLVVDVGTGPNWALAH